MQFLYAYFQLFGIKILQVLLREDLIEAFKKCLGLLFHSPRQPPLCYQPAHHKQKNKTKTEGLESGRYQCFCFVSYSGGSRFILTEQCHRPFRTPGNCFQCIIYLIQTETTVWKVKVNTPVPNFLLNKHRPGFCYSSGSTSEGGLPNHNPSAPTWCTPPCSPP